MSYFWLYCFQEIFLKMYVIIILLYLIPCTEAVLFMTQDIIKRIKSDNNGAMFRRSLA